MTDDARNAVSPDTHTGRHVPASVRHAIADAGVSSPKLAPGGPHTARRALSREEFKAFVTQALARNWSWVRIGKAIKRSPDTVRQRAYRCGIRSTRTFREPRKHDPERIQRLATIAAKHDAAEAGRQEGGMSANAVLKLLARHGISIMRIRHKARIVAASR